MKIVIHPDYAHLAGYIRTIPARFETSGHVLHEGRNCVKVFSVEGVRLAVKKYQVPNGFNRLMYTFFRKDKATRAFRYAARLRAMGVDTPQEIAAIRIHRRGLFSTAYFVSLFCEYKPLSKVFGLKPLLYEGSHGRRIVDAFVRFTQELHARGVEHKDYSLTNVLYREEPTGCRFALIDTNRMRFRKKMSKRVCLSNLRRLDCSLEAYLYVSRQYVLLRRWDPMKGVLGSMFCRGLFIHKQQGKLRLKRLVGLADHPSIGITLPGQIPLPESGQVDWVI